MPVDPTPGEVAMYVATGVFVLIGIYLVAQIVVGAIFFRWFSKRRY